MNTDNVYQYRRLTGVAEARRAYVECLHIWSPNPNAPLDKRFSHTCTKTRGHKFQHRCWCGDKEKES